MVSNAHGASGGLCSMVMMYGYATLYWNVRSRPELDNVFDKS